MTLTEEDLDRIHQELPEFVSNDGIKEIETVIAMARLYRDAEQSGRLLPVLPEDWCCTLWGGANVFRAAENDDFDISGWVCEAYNPSTDTHAVAEPMEPSYQFHGDTPAAAVTAALKSIEN